MTYRADVTIIGAGVVGLAVASCTAKAGREVYVLEKNETAGQEQSSRNSEVVHAGIYYEKGSLKSQLCQEGNRLLYELCEKHGIACRQCGKIIVATSRIEAEEMEKLYAKGRENGVPLQMLSRQEMARLEPHMSGIAAFLSPTTGIIDSHALVQYFMGQAREGGAQVSFRTDVTGIGKVADGYEVRVRHPSGESALQTRVLVNCAGLHSDRVAGMAGIDLDKADYRLHWLKGEFYSVSGGKNRLVNRLIYPVPMAISVGVHVCLDTGWRLRLGPLFHYANKLSYHIDESRKEGILNSSMMKALPFITPDDLVPESAGIMAMLQAEGEGFRDFVVRHEADRGLPGLINLVGIESPGLTSSPALGRYVSRMVDGILG